MVLPFSNLPLRPWEFSIKNNPMNPREVLLALNLLPEVGPVGLWRLLEKFGDAPTVLAVPLGKV